LIDTFLLSSVSGNTIHFRSNVFSRKSSRFPTYTSSSLATAPAEAGKFYIAKSYTLQSKSYATLQTARHSINIYVSCVALVLCSGDGQRKLVANFGVNVKVNPADAFGRHVSR